MTSQIAEAPATEQTTAYHYVISVQLPSGLQSCRTGVLDVLPGATRQEVLLGIVQAHFTSETNLVVLFWSLEPDRL